VPDFNEKKRFDSSAFVDAAISIILRPLFFAFSSGRRQEILKNDGYRCVECHSKKDLVAAHNNHRRDNNYNEVSNGHTRCRHCEVAHHLRYWNCPETIGLTFKGNLDGISRQWTRLNSVQRASLEKRFPDSIKRVKQHLKDRGIKY
jgi:hypothetical protein